MLFVLIVMVISILVTGALYWKRYGSTDLAFVLLVATFVSWLLGMVLWLVTVIVLDSSLYEPVKEETFQYEELSTDYDKDVVTVLLSADSRNSGFTLEIPMENISKDVADNKKYVKVTYYDVKDKFNLLKMGEGTRYTEYEVHR